MYYFYLGDMEIPIPPASMTTTIRNRNKTVSLINGGEVALLRDAGLTEIAFEVLLPNSKYPFNKSFFRFRKAKHYLSKIEQYKAKRKPFQFIVCRMKGDGEMLSLTNIRCTLEGYEIKESHEEGCDAVVVIKLRQYKEYATKKMVVTRNENGDLIGTTEGARPTDREIPKEMTVKGSSPTLFQTLKKNLGGEDALFSIKALNKIAVPTALAVGSVVRRE